MKMVGTQEIRTKRLLLRKIKPEDVEPLLFSGSLSCTSDTAVENVNNYIEDYNLPYTYHWVIEYDNRPIGRVLAWDVSLRDEYCQLGYDISQEFRNQGFMTEAIKAVLLFLLTEADFHRVYCSVRVPNIVSNKVCQKAGMILEGTLRKHYKCKDGYDDVNVYSFIREDL